MPSENFIAQIMSPGGGILLIPFTRAVIGCLFLTTSTVFVMGVARIHMFILSLLSIGFYFALGKFEREYKLFLDGTSSSQVDAAAAAKKKMAASTGKSVSKAKRED